MRPDSATIDEAAFDAIYAEFLDRRASGEDVGIEEYQRRHPEFAERLDAQWQLHRALFADADAVGSTLGGEPRLDPSLLMDRDQWPRLPGYEILGELGRGGMGVVYLAWQSSLERNVALKVFLGGRHARPQDWERFTAEARVIARLQHPNIVRIHEIGWHDNEPYMALEHIDGPDLADALGGKPIPSQDAAILTETLAHAIHEAHLRGVIHRDLKPSNILLAGSTDLPLARRVPKIADFGLARRLDAENQRTGSNAIVGTPSYMAPEQARGQSHAAGPQADVYALGALLYEMLTGRPPFLGASPMQTALQVLHDEPIPPSRLRPGIQPDLEIICLKCLRKDPRSRYATAMELAEDLRRAREGFPISARPMGRWESARHWARRHPGAASMIVAALAILLVVLVGLTWAWRQADQLSHEASLRAIREAALRRRAENAERTALAALVRAESALVANAIMRAKARWESNDLEAARLSFNEALPLQGQSDRRAFEWFYVRGLLEVDTALTRESFESPATLLAPSSDGRLIAVGCGRQDSPLRVSRCKVLEEATGRVVVDWSEHFHDLQALSFDEANPPRLHALDRVVEEGETVSRLWSGEIAPGSNPKGVIRDPRILVRFNRPWRSFAVVPHHRVMVLFGEGSDVGFWNPDSAPPADPEVMPMGRLITSVASNPEGTQLACGGVDGVVTLVDRSSLTSRRFIEAHPGGVFDLEYHPEGRWLISSGKDGLVKVWDVETGQLLQSIGNRSQENEPPPIAVFPDGRSLAVGGDSGLVQLWNLRTNDMLAQQRGHADHSGPRRIRAVAVTPRGDRVWSSGDDRRLMVWSPSQDRTVGAVRLARGFSPIRRAVIHESHGQEFRLTTWSNDGLARVWNIRDGGLLHQSRLTTETWPTSPEPAIVLSPTGRWVLHPSPSDPGRLAVSLLDPEAADPALHDLAAREFSGLPQASVASAVSRDEQRIAGLTLVADGAATRPRLVVWTAGGVSLLTWSGEPVASSNEDNRALDLISFRADGQRIAVLDHGGALTVLDLATGQPAWSVRLAQEKPRFLQSTPRGEEWVIGDEAGTVTVWNEVETAPRLKITTPAPLNGLALSPDGRRLVTAHPDRLRLYDFATGQSVFELELMGRTQSLGDQSIWVAFRPDGQLLACSNAVGDVLAWDATRATPHGDSRAALPTWHLFEAEAALSEGNPFAARFHLGQAKASLFPEKSVALFREQLDRMLEQLSGPLPAPGIPRP